MEKTYHIITIGCQMNISDSERMASFLDDFGYKETGNREKTDLLIINTCGVKQSAEDRIYMLVPEIKKINPNVKAVITGCVSGRPDVQRRLKDSVDMWLPIKDLTKLADFLNEKTSKELPDSYLKIAAKYNSEISAFVPIGNGCNNFCSYCVVPYARGREVYRAADEIIDEVKDLVAKGYKEITLIAQNVNSYADGEIDFADLLKSVNDLEGDFWLRFLTNHPKDMSDKLIETVAACRKVCQHIHLPVQSGDDEILQRMNRKYGREHYKSLVERIRKALPDLSLTTDIIVGFPGETEEQFEQTADLARWSRFDNIFIGQYSPRPYTAAAKFKDDVTKAEKRRREDVLMSILRVTAAENHKMQLGKTLQILVDRQKKGIFYGRTRDNTAVKIADSENMDLIGKFAQVRITDARDFGMDGAIVEQK